MSEEANTSRQRLLSRAEVEELFGFPTKRYLEQVSREGGGPIEVRFGRLVRFKYSDICDWIDAHRLERKEGDSDE